MNDLVDIAVYVDGAREGQLGYKIDPVSGDLHYYMWTAKKNQPADAKEVAMHWIFKGSQAWYDAHVAKQVQVGGDSRFVGIHKEHEATFTRVPAEEPSTFDQNKQAVDIKGYRVLSEDEKDTINYLKVAEQELLVYLEVVKTDPGTNQRSLALAVTNIQTGFMWAIRAIARPNAE